MLREYLRGRLISSGGLQSFAMGELGSERQRGINVASEMLNKCGHYYYLYCCYYSLGSK